MLLSRLSIFKITTLFLVSTSTFSLTTPIHFKIPGELNVISYSQFKPVTYSNAQGYEADLLKAIAKLWKVKIIFHPENIYEGLWRLPGRSYTFSDISIGGFTPTSDRIKEGAYFSTPTTFFKQSLLVRKKDYLQGKITSYHSFKNNHLKIGVVPGTTGEEYAHLRAKEMNLSPTIFIRYQSEAELLPALINGKIDAIARGEIGNEYQAKKNKDFIVIDKKNFHEGFAFAIDKNNKNLINNINYAIRLITQNGKVTFTDWFNHPAIFSERVNYLLRSKSNYFLL